MVDNKLAIEETQRAANYEAVKTDAKSDVRAEIAARANRSDIRDDGRVENMAAGMREKAINEIAETDREVERGRALARVSQIVDYVFFIIYGTLAIRLILELFAARESAGFVKFIKAITGVFYAPFAGIVPSPSSGGATLALPIVVAIVAYMILHLAINGLLRLFGERKTSI